MKPALIIFEGCDGSGKDYTRASFEKETGYFHTCLTRFFLSQLVYSHYFDRMMHRNPYTRKNYEAKIGKIMDIMHPVLIVLCRAEPKILLERISARGEIPENQPSSTDITKLYWHYIHELKIENRVLEIDTTNNPTRTTQMIKEKLDELARRAQ